MTVLHRNSVFAAGFRDMREHEHNFLTTFLETTLNRYFVSGASGVAIALVETPYWQCWRLAAARPGGAAQPGTTAAAAAAETAGRAGGDTGQSSIGAGPAGVARRATSGM